MRKYITLFAAALLLSSCIPVQDFGGYWNRGTVDSSLLGKWPAKNSQDYELVTERKGVYYIDEVKKGRKQPEDGMVAKTLYAGKYTFLMLKDPKSDINVGIARYKIKHRTLQFYALSTKAMSIFLKKKYPNVKNIQILKCKKCFFNGSLVIHTLDKSVYTVLKNIPDTKKFWMPDGEL